MESVLKRSAKNPIITASDLPIPAGAVLNPGATEQDGAIVLLLRVEDKTGYSNIHTARSDNGVTDWKIEAEPILRHGQKRWHYERWGCEDARVSYIPEEKDGTSPTPPIRRWGRPSPWPAATTWSAPNALA